MVPIDNMINTDLLFLEHFLEGTAREKEKKGKKKKILDYGSQLTNLEISNS